jgi:hypothetical protein
VGIEAAMSELWAWGECLDSERWDGPFSTREEAIKAMEGLADTGGPYYVAPCYYPDPGKYAVETCDMARLLEEMHERAGDDGCYCEEPLFEAKKGAGDTLPEMLSKWAREWLVTTAFTVDTDSAEEIKR